ncbi:MAG: hypothetical protein VX311_14805, partial [Planctomycetota bacterium]|nr:hypothetical protein [Planctomycetota bacterium]
MTRFQSNLVLQMAPRLLAVVAGLVLAVFAVGYGFVDGSQAKAAEARQSQPDKEADKKAGKKAGKK